MWSAFDEWVTRVGENDPPGDDLVTQSAKEIKTVVEASFLGGFDTLRAALEAIYGTPHLTLVEARQIARIALEQTDGRGGAHP